MIRRIKRSQDYELSIVIGDESFIPTPRDSQRNWILNRFLREAGDELEHMSAIAGGFVEGTAEPFEDRSQGLLSDDEIMEDWQVPVMAAMAAITSGSKGDVLEIGFGRGVAADFIQKFSPRSHTIVECNDTIVDRFNSWKRNYPSSDIQMLHGMWQQKVESFGTYDGILFHTYPLNGAEFVEQVVQSITFAESFFPIAVDHLKPNGKFTYLTNETDSISRAHQRLIFEHFQSFRLQRIGDLKIPENTRDAFWSDSIAVIEVTK